MKRTDGKTLAVNWSDGTPIGHLHQTDQFISRTTWNGSPLHTTLSLPFDGRAQSVPAEGCDGLPGFIADALPDAWGTRVAEAVFARQNWGTVTPMKLLAWIGDRAPGALDFVPTLKFGATENWL